MLVPGSNLLLGHIGETQELASIRDEPQGRLRGLGVGQVQDLVRIEQVSRTDGQVSRDEAVGLPVIGALPNVAAAGRAVDHVVVHNHGLDIRCPDVALGLDAD